MQATRYPPTRVRDIIRVPQVQQTKVTCVLRKIQLNNIKYSAAIIYPKRKYSDAPASYPKYLTIPATELACATQQNTAYTARKEIEIGDLIQI